VSYNLTLKEDRRKTIVSDQRGMDIGKPADAVVQTDYVCEELSTNIRSVSLLKFREREVFPKGKTSEGLVQKARHFKLVFDGLRCIPCSSSWEPVRRL